MAEFNLIDEPWIPCIDLEGQQVEHGIGKTILGAHQLREICDDSPLVTVALHRLLLAILYRAHNGPRSMDEWSELYSAGTFQPDTINGYLEKWHDRFFLFAEDFPFYQMAKMRTVKGTTKEDVVVSVNRLATECASGNNATLFDHCNDEDEVSWLPPETARWLVASQSFALGFGKSSDIEIDGAYESRPYSADAIALRGMCIWLQGNTLFDTLMANLAPMLEDASLPPWELDDPHKYRDKLVGKTRKSTSSLGTVDRLTWQSRLVLLLKEGETCSRMCFTQGRTADKSPGDPMKTYRKSKDAGVLPLSLSAHKSSWRDAHSILMIPKKDAGGQRPECFNLVARSFLGGKLLADEEFRTHVVGLASAPQKAGKFVLWRHERMPLPLSLITSIDLQEQLGSLLQNAERAALMLNRRIRRIAKLYLSPDAEDPGGRQADTEEISRVAKAMDSRPAFWARLEEHFYTLLEGLPNDWDAAGAGWKPDEQMEASNAWRENIKKEAKRALEESIRSLGNTARAIKSIAKVRTDFYDDDLEQPAAKSRDQ